LIGSSQRLKHYGSTTSCRPYCWRVRTPYFYQVHLTIQPPSTNLDRIPDELKYHPRISPSTDHYRSLENKKSNHHIQFNKHNNLQNKMVEQTYHEMLSTIINELLRPFLAVLTPHVRLHKQLHQAWLTSKRRSL
jgi:hypothetical protein